MSKRSVRAPKGKQRNVRSPSPVISDIEIAEQIQTPTITRKSKPNFYGTPTNRIGKSTDNVDKITTRSTTGISKKRSIPDNGEDSGSNLESPPKRRNKQSIQLSTPVRKPLQSTTSSTKISLNFAESKETTPVQKGKLKEDFPIDIETHTEVQDAGEEDAISDDWDQEELELALQKSLNEVAGMAAESSKAGKDDDELSDNPFIDRDAGSKNAMPTLSNTKDKKIYLEDYDNFTVKTLPSEDQSFFIKVQDKLLRRQYIGLPPLRIGYLLSWNTDSEDIPHIPYSHWPSVIPDMNIGKDSLLMSVLSMTKEGRYFNPSRASPLDFVVRDSYRGRQDVFIGKKPAVAIITGFCMESNLIRGKMNKSIAVIFHGQEWERYCCFVNMIFDKDRLVAQLYRSALTFSTLPESITAPPKFEDAALSPLSGRRAHTNKTPLERSRGALYFTDSVPVYDAREVQHGHSIDFDNIPFPLLRGEVPIKSCVAVGHSISTYVKADNHEKHGTNDHLSTNVLFVIVFGSPSRMD